MHEAANTSVTNILKEEKGEKAKVNSGFSYINITVVDTE